MVLDTEADNVIHGHSICGESGLDGLDFIQFGLNLAFGCTSCLGTAVTRIPVESPQSPHALQSQLQALKVTRKLLSHRRHRFIQSEPSNFLRGLAGKVRNPLIGVCNQPLNVRGSKGGCLTNSI